MNKFDYRYRIELMILLESVSETKNILRAEKHLKSIATIFQEYISNITNKGIKDELIYKDRHISVVNNLKDICNNILKTSFNDLQEAKYYANMIYDNLLILFKDEKDIFNIEYKDIDGVKTEIYFKLYFDKEKILVAFPKITVDIKKHIIEELEYNYTRYIEEWFKELKDLKRYISYRRIAESDPEETLKHEIALRALSLSFLYNEFLQTLAERINYSVLDEIGLKYITKELIEEFSLTSIFENPLKEVKDDRITYFEKLSDIKENKSFPYNKMILNKYKDIYEARLFKNAELGINTSLVANDTVQDIINLFDINELSLNDIVTTIYRGNYKEDKLKNIISSINRYTLIELLNYFKEKNLQSELDEIRIQWLNKNKEISISTDSIAVEERYVDTKNNFTIKEKKGVRKPDKGFWTNEIYRIDTNESVLFSAKELMFRDITGEQSYIEYNVFYTMDRGDRPAIGYEILSSHDSFSPALPIRIIGLMGNKKVNCYYIRLMIDEENERINLDLDPTNENESYILIPLLYLMLFLENFSTSHSKLYKEWVYNNMVTDESIKILREIFTSTPELKAIRDNAGYRLKDFIKGADFKSEHTESTVIYNMVLAKQIMMKEVENFGELQEALNKATEMIHGLEVE